MIDKCIIRNKMQNFCMQERVPSIPVLRNGLLKSGSQSSPPQSIIVLDNISYCCLQINNPSSAYTVKGGLTSWLCKKGVNSNEDM
jgi:hypothetical protein